MSTWEKADLRSDAPENVGRVPVGGAEKAVPRRYHGASPPVGSGEARVDDRRFD